MLELKNIRKDYPAGGDTVHALKGIDLQFRESEFVSILGQSGCGKTTMLNIIGGLDGYTDGDLVINGKSTKDFKDRDWDTYRNHSVGFVFQSYNLIPHQSVLQNVELALSLSGVSKNERRQRAVKALEEVGLGNQLKKKPSEMSGGQMQRVAIARAIVNDPEILLADEPTGALDSATSVQIMELLSEIARDRLVIMVTHNPELADTYSTRIIRLVDGRLTEDTRPVPKEGERLRELPKTGRPAVDAYLQKYEGREKRRKPVSDKKASMSFWTALGLSFKNLLTKKTRTILTAFAGSIGIIGIALIQSVSSGVQAYIDRVQEDTLSSYPITIQKENADLSALLESLMSVGDGEGTPKEPDRVYANSVLFEMMNSLTKIEIEENNLSKFKDFLENDEEIKKYISAVHYSYGSGINFYTKDENGEIYKSDINEMMSSLSGMSGMGSSSSSSSSVMGGSMGMGGIQVFEEMLPGDNGQPVHELVTTQYDLIYGAWPTAYNEVVLIVDANNEISDLSLYALGLKSQAEYETAMKNFYLGKETEAGEEKSWSFEEICAKTYRMILSADCFQKGLDGSYTDISKTAIGREMLYGSYGTDIRVTGIIRKNPDALSAMLSGTVGYTSMLTDYMIEKTLDSAIIKAQLADPTVDVLTGLPFMTGEEKEPTTAEIEEMVSAYIAAADTAKKAEIYRLLKSTIDSVTLSTQVATFFANNDMATLRALVKNVYAAELGMSPEMIDEILSGMSDEELKAQVEPALREQIAKGYSDAVLAQLATVPDEQLAMLLTMEAGNLTAEQSNLLYEAYIPAKYSDATYTVVLEKLGYVDPTFPNEISIYAKSFEEKDKIAACIERYNAGVGDDDKIEYTDYVALLMSSISTVISAISYVLIAFVAISLIVSSIMISIITYISVLERTKEIGVLRAIGASKSDVSRVFNAETLIEGFVSGALGIGVTLLLLIPINAILHAVTGLTTLSAVLPVENAVFLVVVSMVLTVVAGIIPSRMAAKRDPVAALRSE